MFSLCKQHFFFFMVSYIEFLILEENGERKSKGRLDKSLSEVPDNLHVDV